MWILPPVCDFKLKASILHLACEGLHSTEAFHRGAIQAVTQGAVQLHEAPISDEVREVCAHALVRAVEIGDAFGSEILSLFTALVYWCLS